MTELRTQLSSLETTYELPTTQLGSTRASGEGGGLGDCARKNSSSSSADSKSDSSGYLGPEATQPRPLGYKALEQKTSEQEPSQSAVNHGTISQDFADSDSRTWPRASARGLDSAASAAAGGSLAGAESAVPDAGGVDEAEPVAAESPTCAGSAESETCAGSAESDTAGFAMRD
ncbi:hypothetical protein PF001_g22877 [Phytophthora fragariae]|uniref:Uncharacterized protein n=1 Tax=Phytophthora fragariae TaxID=53985 RepID=A0A6A4C0M3_9STRA|nr:hypothetical protein PF001_g22877 [Phytophthora fragariae]